MKKEGLYTLFGTLSNFPGSFPYIIDSKSTSTPIRREDNQFVFPVHIYVDETKSKTRRISVVYIFFGGIKMQVVGLEAKTVSRFFQEFKGVGGNDVSAGNSLIIHAVDRVCFVFRAYLCMSVTISSDKEFFVPFFKAQDICVTAITVQGMYLPDCIAFYGAGVFFEIEGILC